MSSFTPSGVEFIARNVGPYLSMLSKVDQAQQALGRSASSIGSQFATAKGGVASFSQAVGSSSSTLSGFVSSLGNMAVVAGGIVTAQIFNKLVEGVLGFAHAGLEAVSHAQMMEASFQALLTQNNLYAQSTRTVTTAITEQLMSQDDYQFKLRELNAELKTQQATYKEQEERIRQLTLQYGENGLDVLENKAKHEELTIEMEKTRREIDGLVTSETTYSTATKTTWEQVMNLEEAQRLAKEQTADLLFFVEKLAITSPFEQEDVERVTQYAIGAGLGVDVTKKFTTAFLDWSSAVGITSVNLDDAAYQLLQVKKAGTITAIDLRQLSTRGLDLAKVIGVEMGMSVDEFNAKAKQSPAIFDELIDAIVRYSNNTFAGTSQAMSQSIEGFKSTLGDLFTQSAKKVLRPLVDAISPTISEMISRAADFVSGGQAEAIGQALANAVMTGFSTISERIGKVMGAFDRFGVKGAAVSILGQLGFSQETIGQITPIINTITEGFDKIQQAYDNFGLKGATVSLLDQLGMDPETIGAVRTGFATLLENIETLQQVYAQFGAQGAGVSLLSMMGLSSETIALITTNIQTVMESFSRLANWWTTTWPTIQAAALTGWEILKGIFAGFQAALGPILTQLNTQFTQIFAQIGTILSSFGISWSDVWNSLLTATGIVATGIGAAILGIIGVVAGLATGIAEGVSAAIRMFQNLASNVTGIFTGLTTIAVGWVETFKALLVGDFAGAWEGFKIVLDGTVIFWSNIWDGMITVAVGSLDIMSSSISGFVEGIVGFFQGMYDELVGHSLIPDLVNDITAWFKKLPQMVITGMGDLVAKISAPFEDVWGGIKEAIKIDEWSTLGTNAIEGLLEGMKEKAADVLEFLKSLAMDSLTGLGQFWGAQSPAREFIPLGESVPQGLTVGINQAQPNFESVMMGLGQSAINALMTGMRATDESFIHEFQDQLDFGGALTARGVGGHLRRNIRDALKAGVAGFVTQLEGGQATMADVTAWVASIGQQWGKSLSQIAHHVDIEAVYKEINAKFNEMWKKVRLENLSNSIALAGQFASIGQSFADMVKGMSAGFQEVREEAIKLTEKNALLTATFKNQEKELAELQADLLELTSATELDTGAIKRKEEAIAELTTSMDENRQAIQENEQALADYRKELERKAFAGFNPFATEEERIQGDLAMIEQLREFLAGTGQEFRIMGEELGGIFAGSGLTSDIIHNRITAQEELNRLLAEQAEREQAILDIEKAQKQLDFLGQQLNLIKILSDRGLNPRDILGGITLGINASAQDLLEATSRVVTAMVDQINQDLQIASPSRVMMNIGQRVMEGMARGVQQGRSLLDSAIQSTPLLNGSLMQPMAQSNYAGGNITYSTTYEMPMTVHTTATAPAVVRQYEVKRSMYAS